MNSKYTILELSDTEAKRTSYENLIDGKLFIFPHVQLYLRNPSQLKLFSSFVLSYNYSYNLRGIVIPIDRIELISSIPISIRNSMMITIDTMPEAFYYGSLDEDIYKRYSKIINLPSEVVSALTNKNRIQNHNKKDDSYGDELDHLFLNESIRVKYVMAIVERSLAVNAPIINSAAAYIRPDGKGWDITKLMYEQTRRLYLGGTTDLDETSGKRIALNICAHKGILSNDKLIGNIINYISDGEHSAINLKILRPYEKIGEQELDYGETINLLKLFRFLGKYSKLKSIPVHLMCDNTLGYIALMHGIDSYSQPINLHQMEFQGGGDFSKSKLVNPTIDYGRIYSYDVRKPIYHKDYISMIKNNGNIVPCPCGKYCADISANDVFGMKRNEFWNYAKMHLMEMRNYEVDELLASITTKNVRALRSRFKYYFNQFILPN